MPVNNLLQEVQTFFCGGDWCIDKQPTILGRCYSHAYRNVDIVNANHLIKYPNFVLDNRLSNGSAS